MKVFDVIVVAVIAVMCWIFSITSFGEFSERREEVRMMNEAVKNGHARYFLDKDNQRAFEWLPRCSH